MRSCSRPHDVLPRGAHRSVLHRAAGDETAPQIGNTASTPKTGGVDSKPQVAGFIIRDASPVVSNWRAQESLDEYLTRYGVVAISDVDTRRLTRHLRDNGSQNGAIGTEDPATLVDRAKAAPNMEGLDLVSRVTPKSAYEFTETRGAQWASEMKDGHAAAGPGHEYRVVAIDYGAKRKSSAVGRRPCKVTAVGRHSARHWYETDGSFCSEAREPPRPCLRVKTIRLLGKAYLASASVISCWRHWGCQHLQDEVRAPRQKSP